MPINWDEIRYRGDLQDVQTLMTEYRVEDFLAVVDENKRRIDEGVREKLMKDGIRLTEALSPRIFGIFKRLCGSLEISLEPEIFCLPQAEINAFAILDVREQTAYSLIGVTSGALEKLDDVELRSILAHELGHFIFGNHRLDGLHNLDPNSPAVTVLPALGESLYLRWLKKAEISADRVSLIATRDFQVTARALMKSTFGLSDKNLNLDVSALMSQIDEIKGHPELMAATFASHPVLPIRLKAAQLFAGSKKAARHGCPASGKLLDDDALEGEIDALMLITRRYPFRKVDQSVMRIVARAGMKLLAADREPNEDEIKILIQILHHFFTDEPEKELVTDPKVIERELPSDIEIVNQDGDESTKGFILSRLADIALADGALMDPESAYILEVAEMLKIPQRAAYATLVAAAQAVGFRVDARLNKMARTIRRALGR